MGVSIHDVAIGSFLPVLRNLDAILDKGRQQILDKGGDAETLPQARLAPDMLPLARQVQLACDKARNGAARLAGLEPPEYPDEECSLVELQHRIRRTIEYIHTIPVAAFDGAEERIVELPLPGDKRLCVDGLQLIRDWMLPNFYFHVVIAYGILRHCGVDLGKRDFLRHAVAYIHHVG